MSASTSMLLDENVSLKESGVYIGYLILKELKRSEKLSIFDLYDLLRKNVNRVNYKNVMNGLTFLQIAGLVDFREPYITLKVEDDKAN